MAWHPDSCISYNNIGPGPSFIEETQCIYQDPLLFARAFFPGACNACGAMPAVTGVPVLCCAGCQLVSYCNKNCQRLDWKVHKIACKKFPIEMGKNIIVRKTESVRGDNLNFHCALHEIRKSVYKNKDSLDMYKCGMENLFLNPRVCSVCHEARKEKLFDCRCCSVSYCSESHRNKYTIHLGKECDVLYGCALANWYLRQHCKLKIPEGLLNEVNLNDGLNFEKVSKLAKYSSEKWLEAIVHLINERLTFPLTLYHALKKLKLGEERKGLSEITSLTIHIVHSDPMLDPRMWEFMLHQLPNLKILNLTFINRKMKLNTPYNLFLPVERCSDCKRKQRVINYNIQQIYYHEYFSSDDYVQPDVVAVFNITYELLAGQKLAGKDIDKAERFTSQGNMTYSNHTVVILTDLFKDKLEACVKSFHDARPVKVVLPIQENTAARYTILRSAGTFCNVNQHLCCIQGNH